MQLCLTHRDKVVLGGLPINYVLRCALFCFDYYYFVHFFFFIFTCRFVNVWIATYSFSFCCMDCESDNEQGHSRQCPLLSCKKHYIDFFVSFFIIFVFMLNNLCALVFYVSTKVRFSSVKERSGGLSYVAVCLR